MNIVTELQKKDHAGWWNPELHLLAMFIHGIMPTINTVVEIGVQTGGSAAVARVTSTVSPATAPSAFEP